MGWGADERLFHKWRSCKERVTLIRGWGREEATYREEEGLTKSIPKSWKDFYLGEGRVTGVLMKLLNLVGRKGSNEELLSIFFMRDTLWRLLSRKLVSLLNQ